MIDERVSFLVPAYNEVSHIEENILEIVRTVSDIVANFEVIVIDDGSTDDTAQSAFLAALRCEGVRVLTYPENRGKGHALICGGMHAQGDYVVFLDADLDLHPSQVRPFFDELARRNADVVIGSKHHPNSRIDGYPLKRRFFSAIYYLIVRLLFGLPVRDTQTGIKLFRREALCSVLSKLLVKRFAFDLELLANIHRLGFKIVDAPVNLNFQRVAGRISYLDAFRTVVDTLAVFYRMKIRRHYDRPQYMAATNAEIANAVQDLSDQIHAIELVEA